MHGQALGFHLLPLLPQRPESPTTRQIEHIRVLACDIVFLNADRFFQLMAPHFEGLLTHPQLPLPLSRLIPVSPGTDQRRAIRLRLCLFHRLEFPWFVFLCHGDSRLCPAVRPTLLQVLRQIRVAPPHLRIDAGVRPPLALRLYRGDRLLNLLYPCVRHHSPLPLWCTLCTGLQLRPEAPPLRVGLRPPRVIHGDQLPHVRRLMTAWRG